MTDLTWGVMLGLPSERKHERLVVRDYEEGPTLDEVSEMLDGQVDCQ